MRTVHALRLNYPDSMRLTLSAADITGIEFAGELSDLLRTDIPRLFPELEESISLKVRLTLQLEYIMPQVLTVKHT